MSLKKSLLIVFLILIIVLVKGEILSVFFVLSLANILGVRLRSYIENPDSIRRINQVTGVTMILVGVFVALY